VKLYLRSVRRTARIPVQQQADWNWDNLAASWDMAKELHYEYEKGQAKLYQGMNIFNVEESNWKASSPDRGHRREAMRQIPEKVIGNATTIWKAVIESQQVTLEAAPDAPLLPGVGSTTHLSVSTASDASAAAGTNVPVYFICVEGIRLARMVTAADSFLEPLTMIHPPSLCNLLESSSPLWLGWNKGTAGDGVFTEFDLLRQNIRTGHFALVATADASGLGGNEVVYLLYGFQTSDGGMTSFVPVAQILDDPEEHE
jgi:hypothetical protein